MTASSAKHPKPMVSVIVPCFNAARKLPTLLTALKVQTYPSDAYEVIVVDDGSTDATAAVARSHGVRVLSQVNGGSYKARNTGVRQCRGEIIAFTDDDCSPEPDWLSEGVKALQEADADLAGGRMCFDFSNPKSVVELYDFNFHLKQEFYIFKMGWAVTANLFVRKHVIEAVDGFNEMTRSGADRVFGRTATGAGFKLTYAPKAIVRHPTRRTLKALMSKNVRITFGKALVAYEHVHFLPRGFHLFPPGFHTEEVLSLTGLHRLRFLALYYLVEYTRVLCFAVASGKFAVSGVRKVPFRGLRANQPESSGGTA